jgi:hypothetical protein
MGTWGPGNFDSDTAADHLSDLTARLVSEVEEAMSGDPRELEADEYWGVAVPCNLELLYVIAKRDHVGCMLPEAETLVGWKARYMAAWERSIDELGPEPEYRKERRRVLLRTFSQLLRVVRAREAAR